MSGYRPKKRLGQNFLTSSAVIQRIVAAIDPRPDRHIVEIGAGRGALTLPLAETGARVTAVEIDRDLIGYLKKLTDDFNNCTIVNDDFLRLEPASFTRTPFVLVGNLPYQITSPVVEWIVQHRECVEQACLMMQKEVADRLASSPGSKDWSPLAIFTQLYFEVQRCFTVRRECFQPPPAVTSAVVKLTPKPAVAVDNPETFERVVRASFKQRRKLLVNNLAPGLVADADVVRAVLSDLALPTNVRAEQVSTEQFIELTAQLVAKGLIW